jgi:hypothetical protein
MEKMFENDQKAMAEHAKYLKRVKQKKKKQQEQKLEKEKKIEKERKKLEKRKRTDDIFGDEEKMEKKNKKSESHDKLRIVKEKMTTIRAKDIGKVRIMDISEQTKILDNNSLIKNRNIRLKCE